MLQYIIWDASPEIFQFGFLSLRWYGLMFGIAFVAGYNIMAYIFKQEGKADNYLDRLLLYMVVSTVLGARLGHVLFYQPDYYLAHPIEILKVWEGGLASHGAAIAIPLAILLFVRNTPSFSFWWVMDRLVITVALGGALIRTGNLMNSEIIGKPADFSFALAFTHSLDDAMTASHKSFVYAKKSARAGKDTIANNIVHKPIKIEFFFKDDIDVPETRQWLQVQLPNLLHGGEEVSKHFATLGKPLNLRTSEAGKYKVISADAYTIPRHAGQFYEAISCVLLFCTLFGIYLAYKQRLPNGLLFGVFMVVCFGLRFVFEFFKENQVAFEQGMNYNMGQLLSIPAVLVGLFAIVNALRQKPASPNKEVEI